jgi:predicted RNase H-like HicB family nuclease
VPSFREIFPQRRGKSSALRVGISSLESGDGVRYCLSVRELEQYRKTALKLTEVKNLGKGEGYSAKIPGFKGLIVFAETKSAVLAELESALEGWMELSLERGDGLPSLHTESTASMISAH